jgi:putative membrane protein
MHKKTMKQTLAIACLAAGIIWLSSCGNNTTDNKQDSVDSARALNDSTPHTNTNASDFLTKAASGGMLEVEAGQLAQQKAQSQRVKDFGMMMVRDHTKSNEELKAIAAQKGIAIPQTLSDDHQKHLDELKKQNGKDFDKAYMDLMENDHKGDVDEFTDASEKVTDPAIKGFAKKNVPVLQMHLDSAKAVKESIK